MFINLMQIQSELVTNLFQIYPVLNDCVRDISLNYQKMDKNSLAVGLGYTCHIVEILAMYLFVPLRYQLAYKSSHSFVTDNISQSFEGSRE